ncbi:MAG: hypothetical protein FJ102_09255 [Deltaproteobacteria bacterium]|nr:hypothetical protein [Deltaproteobacteria bacterium]
MLLDPTDLSDADRDKAMAAASRLHVAEIRDADSAEFHDAYALLDGFFGPLGELEDREVLARFVRERVLDYGGDAEGTYHLVGAWDGDRLVGVRDCYVDVDRRAGLSLVALSHSLVVPEWRRSGLAAVFRALPMTLARAAHRERYGRSFPTMVAAEMEPVSEEVPECTVRLVAYGKSGFSVLDPRRFRYSQPDFRAGPGAAHTAIAMLGVVRGFDLPEDAWPVEVAEIFPRLFHACHRGYLPAERVDPSENFAISTLRSSVEPVRLLPLPTGRDTLDRLAPFSRERLHALYPPGLRGGSRVS